MLDKSARYLMEHAKQNKSFYLARLRNTSLPELVYRCGQSLLTRRLKLASRRTKEFIDVPASSDVSLLRVPALQCKTTPEMVMEVLNGRVHSLGAHPVDLAAREDRYRGTFFSDIELQAPDMTDIRAVWEPARLQHLTLLLAFVADNPSLDIANKAETFCDNTLWRWIETNPFLFGPHYLSAMECGLRIPVFFFCLKLLYPEDSPKSHRILEAIYQHGWWVWKRLSLFSSLGNHTIAESVGLVFAGAVFKETEIGKRWLHEGFRLLETESKHQILDDGGPAEQSLNYHRFVLDLYWLGVNFLEQNQLQNCDAVKLRLIQGETFLRAFEDGNGRFPSIGDSDDSHAIAPGIAPARVNGDQHLRTINIFRHSGYSVIRTRNGGTLTFDHGPLGMPPLYNHGHADALSITLSKKGKRLLVDPGTYRYNGVPEWRRYFKGTRAHNTVTIDGQDQAVQETGFIWSRPYSTTLLHSSEVDGDLIITAVHDGYARLREPVRHRRLVLVRDSDFIIKDTFLGKGLHHFELNFHLHRDVSLEKTDGWWVIDNGGTRVHMVILDGSDFSPVWGQENPIFGWYSPSYGEKQKSYVLSCEKTGTPREVSFLTAISTDPPLILEELSEILSRLHDK